MNESGKYCIELMKSIIGKNGARISGSIGNIKSVIDLETELQKLCTTVGLLGIVWKSYVI